MPYRVLHQGLHPRVVTEGFDLAKKRTLEVLDELKLTQEVTREVLLNVARSSLMTKIHHQQAEQFTEVRKRRGLGRADAGAGYDIRQIWCYTLSCCVASQTNSSPN